MAAWTRRGRRSCSTRSTRASAGAWPRWSGRKLRAIAERHQVLCVTHLPQIASLADRHYVVRKRVEQGTHGHRGAAARRTGRAHRGSRADAGRGDDHRHRAPARPRDGQAEPARHDRVNSAWIKRKRFFIETFGCQMNVNDSEKVAGLLLAEGYERAARPRTTPTSSSSTPARCARRPSEKLFHAARPPARSSRTGAASSSSASAAAWRSSRAARSSTRAPHVDVLVGTHNVARVPELLRARGRRRAGGVDLDRKADSFTIPDRRRRALEPGARLRHGHRGLQPRLQLLRRAAHARARGLPRRRRRSWPRSRRSSTRGYPEVMLLGQTVNAYRHGGVDFADLLRAGARGAGPAAAALHDLASRARGRSGWPTRFGDLPKRLPVPAPAGAVRAPTASSPSMRRGYTRARVPARRSRCCAAASPDLALSSDVIVGYPGETEADFEATVDLVDEVGFDGLFVFMYSPRPGTTALRVGRRRARRRRSCAGCRS